MEIKKTIRVIAFLVTLVTFCVSCGGDDTNDTNNNQSSNKGSESETLTCDQQKQKLEAVAKEFMSYYHASNFQNVEDLLDYAQYTYNDDKYDCDKVFSWWDNCFDAITKLNSSEGYTNNYSRIYAASNFKGHFNANTTTKRWDYTPASDLQFSFKDKEGKTCTATLNTSGNTKRVYIDESSEYNWDPRASISSNNYYKNYIEIPENINIALTRDGSIIASINITTNLSRMNSDNLSKGSYSATCKINVNDFCMTFSKIYYSPANAEVILTMEKGSKTLVSMSASANYSMNNNIQDTNVNSVNLSLDILGEVRLKGTCSNLSNFTNYIDNANKNDENESNYKSYISQANDLINIGIYYGNDIKQASMNLEPFQKDSYYEKYWYCEPVIKFSDGTSYSTFEAFFDETSFKDVIDNFEGLINEYEKMLY